MNGGSSFWNNHQWIHLQHWSRLPDLYKKTCLTPWHIRCHHCTHSSQEYWASKKSVKDDPTVVAGADGEESGVHRLRWSRRRGGASWATLLTWLSQLCLCFTKKKVQASRTKQVVLAFYQNKGWCIITKYSEAPQWMQTRLLVLLGSVWWLLTRNGLAWCPWSAFFHWDMLRFTLERTQVPGQKKPSVDSSTL